MNRSERIEHLLDELKKNPGDIFYNYALGLEYAAQQGTRNDAERQFRKVLESDPTYIAAYYQLGRLFESSGANTDALHWLRTGLEHARSKNDRKAIGEFEEAIFMLED